MLTDPDEHSVCLANKYGQVRSGQVVRNWFHMNSRAVVVAEIFEKPKQEWKTCSHSSSWLCSTSFCPR